MDQRLHAYEYGAEKHQLYLNHYERHFNDIAQQEVKLFELGIYKGGSLLLWRDFFPNGKVVGLDLNQVNIDDPTGRIRMYQGDQRDLTLLDRIATECAPDGFDIIIDDASHIGEFTKISFWHLFDNHLKAGGYYVIEDWRVSYWEAWPDGAKYKWPTTPTTPTQARARRFLQTSEHKSLFPSYKERAQRLYHRFQQQSRFASHDYGMVGLVKQLIDELGMDAITNPARGGLPPQRFPKFQRMEVCPGQVFIVKATEQDHQLVAESLRHVHPGAE